MIHLYHRLELIKNEWTNDTQKFAWILFRELRWAGKSQFKRLYAILFHFYNILKWWTFRTKGQISGCQGFGTGVCVYVGGCNGRELKLKKENRRTSCGFGAIQDIDYGGRHTNLIIFCGTEYLQTSKWVQVKWEIQIRWVDQRQYPAYDIKV